MHERGKLRGLADDVHSIRHSLIHVFLAHLRGSRRLIRIAGVALHVELAESLQVFDLGIKFRNALDLGLLLIICLKLALSHLLVKLHILVLLLAQVPEGLTLRVQEEIVELTEVKLDCNAFLSFLGLLRLGCRLCTHFG